MEISKQTSDLLLSLEKKKGTLPKFSVLRSIPRNRIIYGAPGTGKSNYLEREVGKIFGDNPYVFTRVTFFPGYTYGQFIGAYKPVPIYKKLSGEEEIFSSNFRDKMENFEPMIDYQFVPGPFIDVLIKALKNRYTNFILIIEEINRANAASVFGDIFQLLDRNKNGESDYPVTFGPDIMNYLARNGIKDEMIKLPSNFFIWATMNNADQGVLPLDTAFKRRWSFEYLELEKYRKAVDSWKLSLRYKGHNKVIMWNDFRDIINKRLKGKVPEDKLLGPFFLKESELWNQNVFKNKLLYYLKEDVFKHNPTIDFLNASTFSELIEKYDGSDNIFTFDIDDSSFVSD
ncbi:MULTISPECIES: type-2 restriction-modification system deoxyribonuclease BsuRB [Bacillus]|uniref:Type II restriction enzyme BsuMI component YdiS n=5 Tax=Bacteria TaxID=2 RepID=YDIS_BACSU|nr:MULTISPECIES: type-2 restriction-modification system deoxyribonuclease BsuRB [Bacillales]NP_388491.1 type-2 restriction enzyme BsuMI component BsuRB (YdiS); prophage region 3 [Bacillus subtilis subsp. subtilis str. 168]O34885.1 RecName: Full=Type II restriction enzyme BsuMI component YdiS; Short=R.BsuM; Short=R.BsuMI; AltName: Full=Endonuclease BsuMI component YdiS; AltName: Full=Type-2 restriction enzyme BsuMI component YdiS [Bacillus subtilis subsp. subtilis str. 168]AOL32401.1 restriction 